MKLSLADYIAHVERGEIPPYPPEGANWRGVCHGDDIPRSVAYFETKAAHSRRGMFAIVDAVWTKALADWLDGRTVLEVMAGAGWLAKALSQHGIDVLATDDDSWHQPEKKDGQLLIDLSPVYPVERLDARAAVRRYGASRDVLLVSWPPMEDVIVEVCDLWGTDRPIVYIGEDEGGCTACDAFFARFVEDEDAPAIPMLAWPMVHDTVHIGYWTENDDG